MQSLKIIRCLNFSKFFIAFKVLQKVLESGHQLFLREKQTRVLSVCTLAVALGLCGSSVTCPSCPASPDTACPPCRSIHQRGPVKAGEHAGELAARQPASYRHHHPAGELPAAAPAFLPPQHQHGLPAQRPLSLPGVTDTPIPLPFPSSQDSVSFQNLHVPIDLVPFPVPAGRLYRVF